MTIGCRIVLCLLLLNVPNIEAQLVINEGSNKNYSLIADEEEEYPDWIELHNASSTAIDLFGYSLSDNADDPDRWTFPHYILEPGAFLVVFCSEKNRFRSDPFTNTVNTGPFTPQEGWNQHDFDTPFIWNGISNIVVNVCSYNSQGYTVNSVFRQSETEFNSSISAFVDGNDAACNFTNGAPSNRRPNIRLNGITIGNDNIQNSPFDYPAPYGNWYWSARHQFLFTVDELMNAGLQPGPIESLAFDVAQTEATLYDYIDFSLNHSSFEGFTNLFQSAEGYFFHTNFRIAANGETVYLFNPSNALISLLNIDAQGVDLSVGRNPNASNTIGLFGNPSPEASNNGNALFDDFTLPAVFSQNSGVYNTPIQVSLFNPNTAPSALYYTLDGSDPDQSAQLYTGTPITIFQNTVIKTRCYKTGLLPSEIRAASYLVGISHVTPIISVITENDNLYGPEGIFDNFNQDWLRAAHVQYFDETPNHDLVFSQATGIIMDGGAGGSRSHPQRSFRLELADGVVGGNPVQETIIPGKPQRNRYSKFYLRNGSNQWQILPYKDAAQVKLMSEETKNYYSGMRPVSVYINGGYFGLYELREKFDGEFFEVYDGAESESIEILSLSFFYGSVLRAVRGSVESFQESREAWEELEPENPNYWEEADALFDLEYYVDYIIGETWMGNEDWPQNNIKIYRSNATNNRWRFCIQDLELAMNPNGISDCFTGSIQRLINESGGNPYTSIWLESMENRRFHDYFINRYADLMNTSYREERLLAVSDSFLYSTVLEMPKQFTRWGDPNNVTGQMNDFLDNHEAFQNDLVCRSEQVRNEIQSVFELPRQVNLELDVFPPGAGKIKISTVTPETYPWEGVYFDGIPVKIEAIANFGYQFSNWNDNPLISNVANPVFSDTLETFNTSFVAFFEPDLSGVEGVNSSLLRLSPNPADAFIELALTRPAQAESLVEILNVEGKVMYSGVWNIHQTKASLETHSLAPGIYIVRLTEGGKHLHTKRFVKS